MLRAVSRFGNPIAGDGQAAHVSTAEACSDAQLIAAGPAEFEQLFDRHHARIHGWLRRRLDAGLAEELAAEVFVRAWAGRASYDESYADASPWLFGIASNLARRHHRQERRGLRALARSGIDPLDRADAGPAASDARIDASAQRRALGQALGGLRPAEREVLLLHAWAELSYEEIALATGVPIGTVRSRLHRARHHVRAHLDSPETS
jgi:RNA polymerase sigma-70 factor (ECF subfamily)